MSTKEEFPEFIQLYFQKEMYHCINGETHEMLRYYKRKELAMPESERKGYRSQEDTVLEKLKVFEQMIIAGKPFFEQGKTNTMRNIERLK